MHPVHGGPELLAAIEEPSDDCFSDGIEVTVAT